MNINEIQISLTNQCEFDCPYCHIDKSRKREMNFSTVKKIVEKAKNNKISHIRLTGGDVFKHPSLFEIIKYINNNGLKVILNSYIQRKEEIHYLLPYCEIVLFSFHNISQIEDNIKELENISSKTRLMGCAVFRSEWLNSLDKLSSLRNKIPFQSFFFLRDVNSNTKNYYHSLLECVEKVGKLNRKRSQNILFSNAFPLCFIAKRNIKYCAGKKFDNGLSRIYINEYGEIKPSAYSSKIIGDLNNDINELWKEHIKRYNNTFKKIDLCKNCIIKDDCGGGILIHEDYHPDPLIKYSFYNKYVNKLQNEIKKSFLRNNHNNDLRLTYHENSSFFMRYISSTKPIAQEELLTKIKISDQKMAVYVHFPFCTGDCEFCTVEKYNHDNMRDYMNNLVKQINDYREILKNNHIESIYFGGGSPQLMGKKHASYIIPHLFKHINNEVKEVNFELHPSNYDKELMDFLEKYVTRVSIGIQCFNDNLLYKMTRRTNKREMIDFIKKIKEKNFEIINFDIIYGLFMDDKENFPSDFKEVISYSPQQVTLQPLHFAKSIGYREEDLKNQIELNKEARKILKEKGYKQITAEDFTKKGRFIYQEYMLNNKNILGIGDGTFSKINDYYFIRDKRELKFHEATKNEELYSGLFLSTRLKPKEISKIDSNYDVNFKAMFSDSLKTLLKKGFIRISDNKIIITEEGREYVDLICNILSLSNFDYKRS